MCMCIFLDVFCLGALMCMLLDFIISFGIFLSINPSLSLNLSKYLHMWAGLKLQELKEARQSEKEWKKVEKKWKKKWKKSDSQSGKKMTHHQHLGHLEGSSRR